MISRRAIFITGASGFIGSNLTARLISSGAELYALAQKDMPYTHDRFNAVRGDVLQLESFYSALKGCDTLFHCAAYISFDKRDFEKSYQVNVIGTKNVLEAAYRTGVKKVVHLSACAVLGFSPDGDTILDETAQPEIKKENIYAYTKKLAEEEVKKYVQKGLDVSIANITTVYGRGDRRLNSGGIIKSVYRGKMKYIPPGGTTFVSVSDLVEGLILLAGKGRPGERYIFCTENMGYGDLVRRIAATLGVAPPRFPLPRLAYYPALWALKLRSLRPAAGGGAVDIMTPQILKETFGYKYFSAGKARRELGWRPVQRFEDAVREAFQYYREHNLI
ncbi:MAG: NAD-dependent epimerase/dehydratase family protein [Candidatus Aureabacteria bacterium]|nr:NAD-dependent epimerase/dehydratase family protein [Candidatus Auribacterota bacterium]